MRVKTFLMLLALVLIGIKVAGLTDLSWWWVFSPLWGLGLVWALAQGIHHLFMWASPWYRLRHATAELSRALENRQR